MNLARIVLSVCSARRNNDDVGRGRYTESRSLLYLCQLAAFVVAWAFDSFEFSRQTLCVFRVLSVFLFFFHFFFFFSFRFLRLFVYFCFFHYFFYLLIISVAIFAYARLSYVWYLCSQLRVCVCVAVFCVSMYVCVRAYVCV